MGSFKYYVFLDVYKYDDENSIYNVLCTVLLKNASIVPVLLSISSLVAIPIALVIPSLAKKIGKRNCIILGCIFVIIGNLGVYLSKFNVSLVIVNSAISAIGYGIAVGITFVMSAETVD